MHPQQGSAELRTWQRRATSGWRKTDWALLYKSIEKLPDLVRESQTRCKRYLTFGATATYVNCF